MADVKPKTEIVLKGIAASPGVCQGRVFLLRKQPRASMRHIVSESQLPAEVKRFEHALVATRHQLLEVQRRLSDKSGADHAAIFEAHLLVLDDPEVNNAVLQLIQNERVNAEYAYHTIAERYAASLASMDDEYLRERAADIRDIASRVLNNLTGDGDSGDLYRLLKEPCICVAHDLAPSQTAQIERGKVLGFATDAGSRTSHTAIMARSMRIPAVVGLKTITDALTSDDYLLLDGSKGVVIINPAEETLARYGQFAQRQKSFQEKLSEGVSLPCITLDGHRVLLSGNIESDTDASSILESGAEGVGLFRTEYLFINQEVLPNEQTQYEAYRAVAAKLKPAPVVIRTLDLGGDKVRSHAEAPYEMNPFLGWRAIRLCLEELDLFRDQLRAILRASAEGNVKLMYPMVTSLDEVVRANALLEECKADLRTASIPFDEGMETGIMVETPSAALTADGLAKQVKFFSLGTNDLIQYALAVDRTNEKIAHLYVPTHPAIVRLIKLTVDAAHRAGIWAGVCGEMAGDPTLVPLLLGLGVDELSAAPPMVPQIKFLIRRLKMSDMRELASFALGSDSGSEILARCEELARAAVPELFPEKS
jgi:phosphotransferase system enzyme I (PtsI)